MSRVFYCILSMALISFTASGSVCNDLNQLSWLEGHWVSKGKKSITLETWAKVSNDTFEGKGESRDLQNQPKSSESLRLVNMSGELFYLAKVAQNSAPVAFKATDCKIDFAIFENKAHDFPNQLIYTRKNDLLEVNVRNNAGQGFSLIFHKQAR